MSELADDFLLRAARWPDDVAVVAPTGTFTYGDIADRVGRLSERLGALTGPGSLIALEASGKLAGLLAVLAAGAARRALLPLDVSYPRARREAVLREARPALLLREDDDELVPAGPTPDPVPRTGLDDVAYVMYTSGSTGTPKGVVVSHRSLARRIAGLARWPGLAAGESVLALTALSFDPSLVELLLPLHVGGTVIVTPPQTRRDPDLFAELTDRYRPDVVQGTPTFWRLVVAAGWAGLPHGRVWCGGEAMTRPLAELLLPRVRELWNVYGPTETTIWSTAHRVTDPTAIGLGEPVPGTGVLVRPDPGADTGSATEGEILLHGVGVAKGYLDRPGLTAASFVDIDGPGGPRRCYRTGDRGRRLADGTLEFLGRIDDQQVKIHGHRVELGDIEAAFESHPDVHEAVAVLVPEDEAGGLPAELVVWVVLAHDSAAGQRELRGWAAERLPRPVMPARIRVEAELPRTPSGKTDRTALRAEFVRRYRGRKDAPLTRAQRFQWFLEKGIVEKVRPLPDGMTESSVRAVVHAMEERFEVLRSSVEEVDGELRQRLHGSGRRLRVLDVAAESSVQRCMAGLVDDFATQRHGRTGQQLVEFSLLRRADQRWLAVVADNVAVDAGFHGVLDDELTRILDGRPAMVPEREGVQPRQLVALESGPAGQRERAEAAAQLRRHFSIAAPRLHPRRRRDATIQGRYYRCGLTLPAAGDLLARAISGTGLVPSALILAPFAQLICWRADSDSCSVNVSMENRHNRELRRVLCATAQRAPVALRHLDRPLRAVAADVQGALCDGYPTYGRYDPVDLLRERAEAEHRRGACLTTDLAFNFVPPPQGWTAFGASGAVGASAGARDGHRPESEVEWASTDELSYEYAASLSVRWVGPRSARLSVHGDAEVITPDQCGALLRGIELALTLAAAGQDGVVDDIARDVGLHRRSRAAHERRVRGRWVDLTAIEAAVRGVDGVEAVEVVLDEDEAGASRVTARVTVAGAATPAPLDLHSEVLKAVASAEILVAPDRYEIAGRACGDGREPVS